jgi:hypothetical protein
MMYGFHRHHSGGTRLLSLPAAAGEEFSEFGFDHRRVPAKWRVAHGIDRSLDLNSFCA